MFPFVLSGAIATGARTDPELDLLGQRLLDALRVEGIVPEQKGGEVTFLNNKNFLAQHFSFAVFRYVDSGTFEIKPESIYYKLSCVLGLARSLPMLVIVLLLGLVIGNIWMILLVLAALLGVAAGQAIVDLRVRRMLRRVAVGS
jgi:hypothetical protein